MWWFESWSGIGRVMLVGFAAYVYLVVVLRISGKRTLSKLNAFDLVVTVAMGSTLSSVLVSSDLPFAEGAAALLVLVVGQYAVAKVSVHWPAFADLVRAEPTLVVAHGRFLDKAMVAERITRAEVLSAIRAQGLTRVEEVEAVVLETDGALHVIRSEGDKPSPFQSGVVPGDDATVNRL